MKRKYIVVVPPDMNMKKIIFFLLLSCMLHISFAQKGHPSTSKSLDSKEITQEDYLAAMKFFDANADQPSEDLQEAMRIAQMYLMRNGDHEGLVNLFETAAQYAKRSEQTKEYIDLKSNKAQLLISYNRPLEGIQVIDSIINEFEITINLLTRYYKAKGDAYTDLHDLDKAEENYFKGLELAQEDQDTFNIGICYISLATLNSRIGNVYDAIDYNIKGLNILEQGDHAYLVTGACNVLCSIFQNLGNYEKAQEYAEKMDQLCRMHGYKQFGAFANAALGRQASHRGDYEEAFKHYDLALKEFDRKELRIHGSNDKHAAYKIKTDLSKIHLKQKEYKKAEALLDEMELDGFLDIAEIPAESKLNYLGAQIELAISKNDGKKVREHISRADDFVEEDSSFEIKKKFAWLNKSVSEFNGDYKKSNEHLTTFFALKDSIEKEHNSQLTHNLEAKYQKAEQEKEISKLSFENERAESQIKQKNIVLILGGIGLAILSILVFQFYKLYQSNKNNKEQLASQNKIISRALEDKNTLLKEIHHRVKNNLQVISSLLSLQSRFIKDKETLDAIKAGKSRVQSMSLLHQNLYRDNNLKGVEMNQYYQNLGQNLFDTYNISENIKFTTDIEDLTLDIDTVVPMGLITNELISNALKHAFKGRESGEIHLSLKEDNGTLLLTVQDDGVGIPDGELPVSYKSLGATLIQSFVEKLEGEIKIDIAKGSKITIKINDYTKVEQPVN